MYLNEGENTHPHTHTHAEMTEVDKLVYISPVNLITHLSAEALGLWPVAVVQRAALLPGGRRRFNAVWLPDEPHFNSGRLFYFILSPTLK